MPSANVTSERLEQLSKQSPGIDLTEPGTAILCNELQSAKAEPPIVVTLFGIVMLVKLVQPLNAPLPMYSRVLGNDIDDRLINVFAPPYSPTTLYSDS